MWYPCSIPNYTRHTMNTVISVCGFGLADFDSFWGGLSGRVSWEVSSDVYMGSGGVATSWHTTHSLSFQLPCHSRSASTPMKFLIHMFIFFLFVFHTIFLFMFVSCLWISILVKIETYRVWIGLLKCQNCWYLSMLFGVPSIFPSVPGWPQLIDKSFKNYTAYTSVQ